jgi:hypothetical protein
MWTTGLFHFGISVNDSIQIVTKGLLAIDAIVEY